MFIVICLVVGAIIFGIYGDGDGDTVSGAMFGTLVGAGLGIILTLVISVILSFTVSPVITEDVCKLEQHVDTLSYTYYVDVKDSKYAFSYFDENTIIREEGTSKVSFTFNGESGEVKVIEKKYGGALDFLFFNLYSPQYDITIPSKEYIRYE